MIEVKDGGMDCQKLKDGERWSTQAFNLVTQDDCAYIEWVLIDESKSKLDKRKSPTGMEAMKTLL